MNRRGAGAALSAAKVMGVKSLTFKVSGIVVLVGNTTRWFEEGLREGFTKRSTFNDEAHTKAANTRPSLPGFGLNKSAVFGMRCGFWVEEKKGHGCVCGVYVHEWRTQTYYCCSLCFLFSAPWQRSGTRFKSETAESVWNVLVERG